MELCELSFQVGNMEQFIAFAKGDPYHLDFHKPGREGMICWAAYCVVWESVQDGFKIRFSSPGDAAIATRIQGTVMRFNRKD